VLSYFSERSDICNIVLNGLMEYLIESNTETQFTQQFCFLEWRSILY